MRIKIWIALIFLLTGCSTLPVAQPNASPEKKANGPSVAATNVNPPSPSEPGPLPASKAPQPSAPAAPETKEPSKAEPAAPAAVQGPMKVISLSPEKGETKKPEQKVSSVPEDTVKKPSSPPKKNDAAKSRPKLAPSKPPIQEGKEPLEDPERDIMEEALMLLNESHNYWVNGDIEYALEMLDQAYAILLDANGSPDVARQKDDLRLLISKRIVTLYGSIQSNAKGMRSEIPIMTNADVEKEIRQFQTVERDFFISSYQRSAMYRPMIVRELKKAGLPEELSWLPLVESGFKVSALSPARALGLWQFIPSTGYKYGLNRDDWVDERMDMEKSTRAAIDYMKELHTMFGDWLTVLAAYNCGEGRVIRTIASQHINYLDRFWDLYYKLPYETARYVPRFIATVLIVRDPQKYGFDLGNGMQALMYDTVETNRSMRLTDIAKKMDLSEENLNILNAELRHRITPDRPYKLRVPADKSTQFLMVADDIPLVDPTKEGFRRRTVVIKHKVRQGETLASIADKYKTSSAAIRSSNRLGKKDQLSAGQRLNVPIQTAMSASPSAKKSEAAISYKVKQGDTLASIGKKYGISSSDIMKVNQLESDTLKTGQVLRIAKVEAEPKKENRIEGKAATKSPAAKQTEASAVKKYTVKKGDSLDRIASENRTTPDKLRQLNKLSSDLIHPGQVIQVQ